MGNRIELGRIAGITIYLDMFFVLVLVISSSSYFTSGSTQVMSAGLVVIAGIFASILLHELGHAAAARLFKTHVTHIDLTGLGGIAHFGSSLPKSTFARVVIYLAGPAANVALYYACGELAALAQSGNKAMLAFAMFQLAMINFYLAAFNLLPAFPLDGGHTLDAILGRLFGGIWAQRIVSTLGLVVSLLIAFFAVRSLPGGLFLLLIAFFILEANWSAFNQVGGFGGGRR
ncbi:MAG: site-2 protease family protein [Hyphomicrobiaceae bacterium]